MLCCQHNITNHTFIIFPLLLSSQVEITKLSVGQAEQSNTLLCWLSQTAVMRSHKNTDLITGASGRVGPTDLWVWESAVSGELRVAGQRRCITPMMTLTTYSPPRYFLYTPDLSWLCIASFICHMLLQKFVCQTESKSLLLMTEAPLPVSRIYLSSNCSFKFTKARNIPSGGNSFGWISCFPSTILSSLNISR